MHQCVAFEGRGERGKGRGERSEGKGVGGLCDKIFGGVGRTKRPGLTESLRRLNADGLGVATVLRHFEPLAG